MSSIAQFATWTLDWLSPASSYFSWFVELPGKFVAVINQYFLGQNWVAFQESQHIFRIIALFCLIMVLIPSPSE